MTEKTLEISVPLTEVESQPLIVTVPHDKYSAAFESFLPKHSEKTTPITKNKTFLHGSYTSLNDEMETKEESGNAFTAVQTGFPKNSQ